MLFKWCEVKLAQLGFHFGKIQHGSHSGCCKTRFCRMCHKQGVFAYEWLQCWGVLMSQCVLESMVSKRILNSSVPHKRVCCWKRTASFCSPHCSRSRYSSHALWLEYSCQWTIPMSLMCETFWDIFLWVNIQYSVNAFDIWYVRLHICDCANHTKPPRRKTHSWPNNRKNIPQAVKLSKILIIRIAQFQYPPLWWMMTVIFTSYFR